MPTRSTCWTAAVCCWKVKGGFKKDTAYGDIAKCYLSCVGAKCATGAGETTVVFDGHSAGVRTTKAITQAVAQG